MSGLSVGKESLINKLKDRDWILMNALADWVSDLNEKEGTEIKFYFSQRLKMTLEIVELLHKKLGDNINE